MLTTQEPNVYGCSGIDTTKRDTVGGDKCCIAPRKVDGLCKKELVSIVSSCNPHVLAITKSGKVYSWGHNGNCDLGHGTSSPSPNPTPTIITKLEQFQVKQVACGCSHSMALTSDGKVHQET